MNSKMLLGGLNLDSHEIKHMLDSQQLVDCTLACDGGKISTHKVVLSACSSYLAKILHEHPVEHPIIILPELKIEDVKTLVHYMYTGELLKSNTVNTTNLLRTAAILSVNSLTDFLNGNTIAQQPSNDSKDDSSQKITSLDSSVLDSGIDASGGIDNDAGDDDDGDGDDMDDQSDSDNINAIKREINLHHQTLNLHQFQDQQQLQMHHLFTPNLTGTTTLNGQNSSITTQGNGITYHNRNYQTNPQSGNNKSDFQFKCPVCQNDFQTICSFEYHMQRVHNVTSFGCEICHKPFASLRYVLTDHMRRCHGWKAEQKLHC